MAAPSVTYTFSNSTTADASQVNQNFTDIINGVSDGTKDLSISALTVAGIATFNGNVTLGNASGDDVTVTGSLASTIPIKTTNTYDIGSSTKGLRYIYIGDTADANTHKIQGQAVASDVVHTLPAYTGTVRHIPSVISAQTTTYAILLSDEYVPCNASGGSFTVTLPSAATVGAGKVYTIKRTDQTLANAVTIATTSSQSIDGPTSRKLKTQYEAITVMSDGSNWTILDRRISPVWEAFTPTGAWTTNTSYSGYWRRIGESIHIQAKVSISGGAPDAANFTLVLPTGLTIDTAKAAGAVGSTIFGDAGSNTGASSAHGGVMYNSTTSVYIIHQGGASRWSNTTPLTWASGDIITLNFTCPITDWEA